MEITNVNSPAKTQGLNTTLRTVMTMLGNVSGDAICKAPKFIMPYFNMICAAALVNTVNRIKWM